MMIELAPGAELVDGRYRIERLLGSGGMATVWLAEDRRLGRTVAIKAISDALAADPAYVRRFTREARIAAGLSHPSLVRVYDFATEPRPLLVMEHIGGGTLADRLRTDARNDIDAHQLARELLDALGHIHGAGIVHRDVKPPNVLIGTDGRARLTDFGIAHDPEATQLTQAGQVLGTMRYIAPEVMAGQPATWAADLYALGVLLDQAAGGAPSAGLRRVLDALRNPDPSSRPTAAEAAAMLDHPGPGKRPRRRQVRALPHADRRHAVLAAFAVVAALMIAVLGSVGNETEPTGSALPEADRPALDRDLGRLQSLVRRAAAE